VLKDSDSLDSIDLYDGKEIFLQHINPAISFSFTTPSTKDSYHVLFREWSPDTWLFGPIFEVLIDKQCYSNKLAVFLSSHVFPHIPAD
jgi:hypothetical protein